jgi:hypothetical protein
METNLSSTKSGDISIKNIKFKSGIHKDEFYNVFNLVIIAETSYLYLKFDEWWNEVEKVWEDKELRETGYVPFLYLFKGRLWNVIMRDFKSINEIIKKLNIRNKSFKIGCIEYRADEKEKLKKYQLVNSEVERIVNDIFLIPDELIFVQHRVNWEIIIPMIVKESGLSKSLPTREEVEEKRKKDLVDIIVKAKDNRRSKNRKFQKVSKLQIAKDLGIEKNKFYEITKNIPFDIL